VIGDGKQQQPPRKDNPAKSGRCERHTSSANNSVGRYQYQLGSRNVFQALGRGISWGKLVWLFVHLLQVRSCG